MAVFLAKLPSVDDLQPAVRAGLIVALAVFVLWGASGLRLTTSLYELNNAPQQMLLDAGRAATLSAAPSISGTTSSRVATRRKIGARRGLGAALYEKRGRSAFAGIGLVVRSRLVPVARAPGGGRGGEARRLRQDEPSRWNRCWSAPLACMGSGLAASGCRPTPEGSAHGAPAAHGLDA